MEVRSSAGSEASGTAAGSDFVNSSLSCVCDVLLLLSTWIVGVRGMEVDRHSSSVLVAIPVVTAIGVTADECL